MNIRVCQKAFTLLELSIVVILLGVMAGFATVTYQNSKERTYERAAARNLDIIREALRLYKARSGDYNSGALSNADCINQNLGINIIADQVSYDCQTTPTTYVCTAAHASIWALKVDSSQNNGAVRCSSGSCPSCNPTCPF